MINQRTLKHKISYAINRAALTFTPANINSGIIFHHRNRSRYIKIDYAKLTKKNNNIFFNHETHLEHYNIIIAALYICGINNTLVQIENNTFPKIMLQKLIFMLAAAGQITQLSPLRTIQITTAESIQRGKTYVKITPHDGIKVTILSNNTEKKILHEFDSNLQALQQEFSHINHYSDFSCEKEQMQCKTLNMLSDLYASGINNAHLQITKEDNNNYFQLIKSIASKQSQQHNCCSHLPINVF